MDAVYYATTFDLSDGTGTWDYNNGEPTNEFCAFFFLSEIAKDLRKRTNSQEEFNEHIDALEIYRKEICEEEIFGDSENGPTNINVTRIY